MTDRTQPTSGMRWQTRFALLVLLTLMLGVGAYLTIDSYVAATTAAQQAEQREHMVAVVVIANDSDAGQIITANDLQQRMYPPEYVNDSWLVPTDVGSILGRRLIAFVERGQPLTLADLELDYTEFFSQQLAKHEVAITVNLSLEQSHHGMLSVGDRVTIVMRDTEDELQMIQAVRIAALDHFQMMQTGPSAFPTTATLAMDAEQAVRFEALRFQSLSFWLRHPHAEPLRPLPQLPRLHFFQ